MPVLQAYISSNHVAMPWLLTRILAIKKVKIWPSPLSKANLANACLLFITVVILDFFL